MILKFKDMGERDDFFKLYLYVYMKFCLYFHQTPEEKSPREEMSRLMDKDVILMLKEFSEELSFIEMDRAIEKKVPTNRAKVWTVPELHERMMMEFEKAILKYNSG